MPPHYLHLAGAIVAEIIATSALARTDGFTRLVPSVLVVVGYAAAFWLLSLALKAMPVGVVYAIWAGLGVVGVALIGLVLFGQKLDAAAVIGMALIVAGVVVINVFSDTTTH